MIPSIDVRGSTTALLRLTEVWTDKSGDFENAYLALYCDLEVYAYAPDLDQAENTRQRIDEALLQLKSSGTLYPDEHTYERELARLEACFIVASLHYQIALGFKLPDYSGVVQR